MSFEERQLMGTNGREYFFKNFENIKTSGVITQQKKGSMNFQKNVETIQIGLILLGFSLPRFGVDGLFELACEKGHLKMAKWLYGFCRSFLPDTSKDDVFRKACEKKHLNIVEWFVLLRPDRYSFTVEEKEIITIIPHIDTDIRQEMYECDILPCSICDDESQIITIFCNHQFCRNCMDSWTKIHESCPLCREFIAHRGYFTIVPKKF